MAQLPLPFLALEGFPGSLGLVQSAVRSALLPPEDIHLRRVPSIIFVSAINLDLVSLLELVLRL